MGGVTEKDRPFVACSHCLHHFSIEKIGGKYMEVKCPSCDKTLYVTAVFVAHQDADYVHYLTVHVQEVAIPLATDLFNLIKRKK